MKKGSLVGNKESQTGHAEDDLDRWFTEPEKPENRCQTCKCGPEITDAITKFIDFYKTDPRRVSAFWKLLKAHRGYPYSYDALIRHMNRCLGFVTRG